VSEEPMVGQSGLIAGSAGWTCANAAEAHAMATQQILTRLSMRARMMFLQLVSV
jgi:hypothetical protein